MKLFHIFSLVALLGCALPNEESQTAAPDGFYVESTSTLDTYRLRVVPPGGGEAMFFHISHYTGFVPQRVVVFGAPEGYWVQVSGQATHDNWSQDSFIVIANDEPYFELVKAGQAVSASGAPVGGAATVSLVMHTKQEAEAVATALRRRYSLRL